MKRFVTVIAVVAVALLGFGAGSAGAWVIPYTQPGVWFAPGQQRHSDYDSACIGWWYGNNFSKSPASSWGLVTFIIPSGSWRYTEQGPGHVSSKIPSGQERWSKKLLCRNNSSRGYQGGCWGDRRDPAGACA